jgi:predicted amidohydrolase YtcJ
MALTLRAVELDGRSVDVTVDAGRIAAIEPSGRPATGAVLPGLHDHHLHLLAMAARAASLSLTDHDRHATDRAIREAAGSGWLRVVDLDEERSGPLDRARLDALAPTRPVRVQDRSGACWTLNSAALAAVGLDAADGRLWRMDEVLAGRIPHGAPDLAPVLARLAARGVTGVTDATPYDDSEIPDALRAEHPVAITVLGPRKLVLADHDLPAFDDLAHRIGAAHAAGRPVAVHCVTRVAAALLVAAWDAVGTLAGDRVEHGSVLDEDLVAALARLGVTVVTQPAFVHARGDDYLDRIEDADRPHLYRCRSLLDGGVPVGGSTDAPFGPDDPWAAVATAVDRRTRTGRTLGPGERLDPRRALDLFLTAPDAPGGRPRRVAPGAPADLCVLDRPLAAALDDPASVAVVRTLRGGWTIHEV